MTTPSEVTGGAYVEMDCTAEPDRPDVTVKPPQWVVNAMAFIGRCLGYTLE